MTPLTRVLAPDDDGPAAGADPLYRDSDLPAGTSNRALRRAAVLMPLLLEQGAWHLLFIRRAKNERDRHSGQVAFPGGAEEASDGTLQDTALREAHEEIGLEPATVTVLRSLPPYLTISHYCVTPVVGTIQWPFEFVLQQSEVARAFTIPLDWLRDHGNLSQRARTDIDPGTARRHPVIVYDRYDGEVLWGASARMTLNLLREIDAGRVVLPG